MRGDFALGFLHRLRPRAEVVAKLVGREVFRLHRTAIPGGWDIVMNPRQGVAKVAFPTLEREILKLFPKAPPPEPAPKKQIAKCSSVSVRNRDQDARKIFVAQGDFF